MAVLVAGGTGALGGAVLRELAESGYDVTATWLVEKEAERIESELGDSVRLLQANLLDAAGAAGAVAAGGGPPGPGEPGGGVSPRAQGPRTPPGGLLKMNGRHLLPGV